LKVDLVLLALGFVSPVQDGLLNELGVDYDARGNVKSEAGDGQSSVDKVFAVGDATTGASLVVRAMENGKKTANSVDAYLKR